MQMEPFSSSLCMRDDFQCRLCLSSADSNLQQLFPSGVNNIANERLSRIYECLEIHVSFLEDFWSVICTECTEKIDSFYTFKKQCQSNNSYLRRKRSSAGAEFERIQCTPDIDKIVDCEESIAEPDNGTLLNQTREIFFPGKMGSTTHLVQDVKRLDKEVQTCSESTSETFCGFPLESYSRRSPRIFIKNSIKEAFERQQPAAALINQKPECRVSIEMLYIKPEAASNIEKADLTPQLPKLRFNPMSTKKKATLYFEGFQYSRPKLSHNGNTVWSCCLVYCPARLEKDPRGAISVDAKLHKHRPQVIREGVIFNSKHRRNVRFVLVKTSGRLTFIYNDAYLYRFDEAVSSTKSVWLCQEDGCKSFVNILGDFHRIVCMYKHNHREGKVVFRRNESKCSERGKGLGCGTTQKLANASDPKGVAV
ncbi:uncharacterized protein LOC131678744 [Topomyia yanbarensis]|uniref:uncharacterized protein LOC131678744 n=1 Tax=Topomyia yanbarensis TaxID=2498891 RepID=UPI00273BA838|nr:uncharacterized protein LOC131678744 [Topomyia yanbarensis]